MKSLALFGLFFPLSRAAFQAPVFFLFLSERFSTDRVLLLSAIYYFSVVSLEVPSGYLSDRVSRVAVLRIAMGARALSFVLFLVGGTRFEIHVAAEIALAASWACLSGTDTSYHYDTLQALERDDEYPQREQRLARNAYGVAAASVLIGGGAALVDLRLPYLLGAIASVATLGLTLSMKEAPRPEDGHASEGITRQLRSTLRLLRDPVLAWIFVYVIAMLILEHVPYEFAQPYVALVLGETASQIARTPVATGLLYAGVYGVASLVAGHSLYIQKRLGIGGALLMVTALQTAIIGAMAWVVSPLVVPLLLLRSVQPAISQVIINTTCSPRIPKAQRATFFSFQSLAGRLGYGLVLITLSAVAGHAATADAETMHRILRVCVGIALVALIGLALTRRAVREAESST